MSLYFYVHYIDDSTHDSIVNIYCLNHIAEYCIFDVVSDSFSTNTFDLEQNIIEPHWSFIVYSFIYNTKHNIGLNLFTYRLFTLALLSNAM